ncbi:MAG: hypothetical protein RLZZ584_2466 [Pseudomonadota bacterium]
MPYYVYALKGFGRLEAQGEHGSYREASAQAKSLRAQDERPAGERIKVIFADDALQAEDLLLQVRDPRHEGGDD